MRSQHLSTASRSRDVGCDFDDRHPSCFANSRGSLCQRFSIAGVQDDVDASFCQRLSTAEAQAFAGTAHQSPAALYS